MKSQLLSLWQKLADESASWCCTSTARDYQTVASRFEHEGESFLTITLPSFGSDFQKSLAQGAVDPSSFSGFHFRKGLPQFLGGFLDLVFDRTTGRLLDNPSVEAIRAVRQLTMVFGKIQLPCTTARETAALVKYVESEQHVRDADKLLLNDPDRLGSFERVGRLLWADVFSHVDREIFEGNVVPRHGPGSTADGYVGNDKYRQVEWTTRLEEIFPSGEFLLPNWRYFEDLDPIVMLEPGAERPVKVITVPKTLKSPRIIAMEPVCMQYVQQGIMEKLVEAIETSRSVSWLVGFTDQEPNRRLARQGSETGELATLDLSEASDRVSNQHVRILTANHPWLRLGVDACRSRKADVLGKTIRLAKFASMGSALCFPFEAMVFATVIFVGIEKELGRRITAKDVQSFRGRVRVYGDDIIVPVEFVRSVISSLEAFGFKVNYDKSFWTGRFRESCGGDYYDGEDITVLRFRRVFPTSRTDVQEVLSTVAFRNQLYLAGYWQTVRWLDEGLTGLLRHYPVVEPTSPLLGRYSFLGPQAERECPFLHRPIAKGFVVRSRYIQKRKPLDGPGALLKVFLKRGDEPFADRKHLERQGRPDAVDIKLGWGPVV